MFILKRNFLKQGEVQCTFGGIMMTTYLIIILVILIGYYVFMYFRQKAFTTFLTQKQFIEGYRKAQLIDVREPSELDRKSTRLNSSHVAISYAVFCLKKKKNK